MSISTITPEALNTLHRSGKQIELIDVRTPVEFNEVHVDFAKNIPLDQLDPQAFIQARNDSSEETLYLICRSGSRGQKAREKFVQAGFTNVINIEGGTLACESTSLPLTRGKKSMGLERQVRIAAGSLVVLGVVLSVAVHPWCVGLSAFVGAGLVFAGITDTCAMGMLIARMPWNQIGQTSS
ncbi:MAG: rhodanese-like domain-containing protein [Pirellulales bacterium]